MIKQKAIICDLDGTLFNIEHRRVFVIDKKPDWKSFNHPANLEQDTVNDWCKLILLAIEKYDINMKIIFVSGREESLAYVTKTMLLDNGLYKTYGSYKNLYMRKNGDYRQDAIIKEEIYKEQIEPLYDVVFCIDDRKQTTNMWRSLGLVCLQCAEGDF